MIAPPNTIFISDAAKKLRISYGKIKKIIFKNFVEGIHYSMIGDGVHKKICIIFLDVLPEIKSIYQDRKERLKRRYGRWQ